jgi:GNAT superfamily N-acetyltransferase
MLTLSKAKDESDLAALRALMREYVAEWELDLGFQDFEGELAGLPGKYALPDGCILLATDGDETAGCAALRPLGEGVCELKRMYVRPAWRKRGVGRMLAEALIACARQLGYRRIRLDTVGRMAAAQALYRSLGFRDIPPYYPSPLPGAMFMELTL